MRSRCMDRLVLVLRKNSIAGRPGFDFLRQNSRNRLLCHQHGFRSDYDECVSPIAPDAGEQRPEEAVPVSDSRSGLLPLVDGELLTEGSILAGEGNVVCAQPAREDEQEEDGQEEGSHGLLRYSRVDGQRYPETTTAPPPAAASQSRNGIPARREWHPSSPRSDCPCRIGLGRGAAG